MSKEKKTSTTDYIKIDGHKPKVKISWEAWKKIKTLLGLFDFEFCFLLEMDDISTGLRIHDVHIVKQTGSAAYTEMKKEALDSFCLDCMSGVKDIDISRIKGWGHSHAKMACFESGTDVDTSRKEFGDLSNDWSMSLVVNLAGDYYCALHLFRPVASLYLCELDIEEPEYDVETVELDRDNKKVIYGITEGENGVLQLAPMLWENEAAFTAEAKELIAQPTYTAPAVRYGNYYGNGYTHGQRYNDTDDLDFSAGLNKDTRKWTKSSIDDEWDPKYGWVPKGTANKTESATENTKKDTNQLQTPNRGVRNMEVFKQIKETLKGGLGSPFKKFLRNEVAK